MIINFSCFNRTALIIVDFKSALVIGKIVDIAIKKNCYVDGNVILGVCERQYFVETSLNCVYTFLHSENRTDVG